MTDNILGENLPGEILHRCVVRVKTAWWHDKRGAYMKKSVILMKRLSALEFFTDSLDNEGAENMLSRIINLDSAEDGLYELTACNERIDWESGVLDCYDFKLIPL